MIPRNIVSRSIVLKGFPVNILIQQRRTKIANMADGTATLQIKPTEQAQVSHNFIWRFIKQTKGKTLLLL